MADPVYFLGDAHLGSSLDPRDDAPRLDRLVPFLRRVGERRARHLYVLGDLFDFWFEYRHVVPWRHVPILTEIRRLVDAGIPVSFLGGNHDWWTGRGFREISGMTTHAGPISVEHQGRRLFLAHGDGLASRYDSGYLLLKRVIRNRWVVRLLSIVHPDLAYAWGYRLSRLSRQFRIAPQLGQFIDRALADGHDAVLMGHLHARHQEDRAGGGQLFVLGDWMTLFSALRLEDGAFRWEDWSTGEPRDVVDPAPTVLGGHGDE